MSVLCPCCLPLFPYSFIIYKLGYIFVVSVDFALTMGPTGHLATIYRRLIVSDGRGSKKKEGKIYLTEFRVAVSSTLKQPNLV